MDSQRFDALTRRVGVSGSRRQAITAFIAGTLTHVVRSTQPDEAAAKCKGFNKKCEKNSSCCADDGLRCVKVGKGGKGKKGPKRRCRCKNGTCPSEAPCCIGGKCQELCDGECCADCFVEILLTGTPDLNNPVCCPGSGGTICGPNKKKKSDDRCCYPDQVCINGECCCDFCEGSVPCGGKCCAIEACCNGNCCAAGQVCAMTAGGEACVSANRACGVGEPPCFAGEDCHGGVCCSGLRVCNDGTDDFCCGADEYCQFPGIPIANCCPINTGCGSTFRGHRVRR